MFCWPREKIITCSKCCARHVSTWQASLFLPAHQPIEGFQAILEASLISAQLPDKVAEFAQLHCGATTVQDLWKEVASYHVRMRMTEDLKRVHGVSDPPQTPIPRALEKIQKIVSITIVARRVWPKTARVFQNASIVGRLGIRQRIVGRKIQQLQRNHRPRPLPRAKTKVVVVVASLEEVADGEEEANTSQVLGVTKKSVPSFANCKGSWRRQTNVHCTVAAFACKRV